MRILSEQKDVQATIIAAAERHQVPPVFALAFAWCESKHNPRAEGDLQWHERDGGRRYRRLVLEAPRFTHNPAREEPEAWHSYGLFQLLACYHCEPEKHPRTLLEASTNAELGVRFMRSLLNSTGGDIDAARVRYVGLPLVGPATQTQRNVVLANLKLAISRFEGAV